MGKLTVIEWISLDGVYDTNLFDKWFFPFDSVERQQYIKDTTQANTAILYGKKTYEELSSYWSENHEPELSEITEKLNKTPKYVISNTLKSANWQNTTLLSGDTVSQISELKSHPNQEVHVNGSGVLVQHLAKNNLIDELHLLIHPIIVGAGKKFFVENLDIPEMQLMIIEQLPNGVILAKYAIAS